jgi:hypothetical protein
MPNLTIQLVKLPARRFHLMQKHQPWA